MNMIALLNMAVNKKASDLHLSAGLPAMIRVNGDIQRLQTEPLNQPTVHHLIKEILSDKQNKNLEANQQTDFAFELPSIGRFRVNVFWQNRGLACVCRLIPHRVPTLVELGMPKILTELLQQKNGLLLVTGSTGSGKSTTLAAMLNHINQDCGAHPHHGHILTIEDPIEFVHQSQNCLINQREIHTHVKTFSNALHAALREDPDVIMVGEMRDLETIRLALTAAETGHLVLATLHTSSSAKTIDRIIDVFPGEEKNIVRSILSQTLVGIISQTLVKRSNTKGRVAAQEIMIATPAIRHLIREDKISQLVSSVQTGRQYGMQTLEQSLKSLQKNKTIASPNLQEDESFQNKSSLL